MARKKFVLLLMLTLLFFIVPWNAFSINAEKANEGEKKTVQTTEEIIEYTPYELTIAEAVDIQLHGEASPITSLYYDAPGYVRMEDVSIVQPVWVFQFSVFAYEEPKVTARKALEIIRAVPIHVVDIVEGDVYGDSSVWYKVVYGNESYYIPSSELFAAVAEINVDTEVYAGIDDDHVYGMIRKGKRIIFENIEGGRVKYREKTYWRKPREEDVASYMDPDDERNSKFQHLRLDSVAGATMDELDRVLEGQGVLAGRGKAFYDAVRQYPINEAYLIAHAFLETGRGSSELAVGVRVGLNEEGEAVIATVENEAILKEIRMVYNMFGIGAVDSCPVECGAKTAYENEWFSIDDAIIGGAEWIGARYIYNEFEQNTLYKMRWNPQMYKGHAWKQYATDIGWAEKQTDQIREIYEQFSDVQLHFDFPLYRN